MFHKALNLEYKNGTTLDVTFQSGEVKRYDVSALFAKYPQMEALKERSLFLFGKLTAYGIIWNDELDLELETVYEDGELVQTVEVPACVAVGSALQDARAMVKLSQIALSEKCGIDQSVISKIESGVSNPSVETLERLAAGLGLKLIISFD